MEKKNLFPLFKKKWSKKGGGLGLATKQSLRALGAEDLGKGTVLLRLAESALSLP